MNTYRVGIVGSGFGGSVHAPAYAAHARFEPVAIASPNSARRVAGERQIPHAFSTLEAMLDAVDVDVVSIASPPAEHGEAVLLALARGKHVLAEKPMAHTVAQAEAMLAAAKAAGTVCGIAHEFRFAPSRQAMVELVRNRHLGALREIECTYFAGSLRADAIRPRSGWWFSNARGGGIAQAVGSHMIDTANWLAGRAPLTAHGFCRTANPQRTDAQGSFTSDVADGMFGLLDYGDGLIARVTVDAATVLDSTTIAIHGEGRSAAASGSLADATMFTIDGEETSELQLKPATYARFGPAHPNLPPFLALLDTFADALDGNPHELPSFEDGLATQRVLAAIGYGT